MKIVSLSIIGLLCVALASCKKEINEVQVTPTFTPGVSDSSHVAVDPRDSVIGTYPGIYKSWTRTSQPPYESSSTGPDTLYISKSQFDDSVVIVSKYPDYTFKYYGGRLYRDPAGSGPSVGVGNDSAFIYHSWGMTQSWWSFKGAKM